MLEDVQGVWIKATQSDSSCAGMRVWDALLNLAVALLVTTKWTSGEGGEVCLVNEKLFS